MDETKEPRENSRLLTKTEEIQNLGAMLSATTEEDKDRMKAIASRLQELSSDPPKQETKKPWLSRGVWGGFVTIVVIFLAWLGVIDLSGEEDTITDLIVQLVLLASGVLALIGRVKAKKEIKL